MNDRSEEGTYTWIDGSIYSHTNWTVVEPSVSDEDCVEIIRAGEGSWGTVSCEMIRNTFICRRPSNSTLTTVGIFGELTNEGLDFQILNGNTFLHESTTLVCGGLSDEIIWRFAENAEFTNSEELIATHSNTESGLSWLAINISKQGYYQCRLTAAFSHTIGLYDLSLATVPQIIVRYGDMIVEHISGVFPAINYLEIPIGVKDVSITSNIEGNGYIQMETIRYLL
ncbi:Macrophage mannose receptor 1-like [Oopsacas minuta]|uniref:Macrophage mannose receptor 1-like n=1 Tax=Oopsacas minuta TaxID=111878 RepID=A0AAV7KCX9_9METZ|nr:Macrophage mannose receptor 1-like [Oopsacas minuta]